MDDRLRMDEREFDGYLDELEKTRAAFPDLIILSGVEADYIASMGTYIERFLSSMLSISSSCPSTSSPGWRNDEWTFDFHNSRTIPSAYRDYFQEMLAGIETGLFDCVAHLDLIKQPGSARAFHQPR